MPVVEPDSFISFQINPHYTDSNPSGHTGETREQRIMEFIEINPDIIVAGLQEGTMLIVEGMDINLSGPCPARIFKKGELPRELSTGDDFSFLLK
jgi:dipeptidase E